jgi:hypothetical protein
MATKILQIVDTLVKDADTLDGKHAEEFALVSDIEALQIQVGDGTVAEQISTAVAQKTQVQIITWGADD